MVKTRIAINGFGRIGRMVFRQAVLDNNLEVVAVNASYPSETLVHLIKYDSVHGIFDGEVNVHDDGLQVNGHVVRVVNSREPDKLPWKELDIDVVIEATGKFTTNETAGLHMQAGAKKVVITAPGKDVDKTIVLGVNEDEFDGDIHHVISNASCTTNCLAPVAKILDDNFKIVNGLMTTVHAFTTDQNNLDNPHKDLRRARSNGQSIIPTSTGAAKALGIVLPHLNGKLHGMALRVPTPDVSLVDLVVDVEKSVTVEEVNKIFKEASENELKGILGYSEELLVSSDYIGDPRSSIVDGLSTMVIDNMVKVVAWYDNEWGYSERVLDLAHLVARK